MKFHTVILFLLTAFFIFSAASARPAPDSTLVQLDEIHFSSPFEKEVFYNFLVNGSKDYFSLFLCIDSTMNLQEAGKYRAILQGTIEKYNTSYYQNMNEKKRVSKIYSSIHEEMLDKYTLLVPFSSIFTSGEYHCVSSSMLYALVFDAIQIPYEIKLAPNHIYLVAFPGTYYITVETTDPLHGAILYDQTFKAKFVEYLRDAKLISKEEYSSKSMEVLFEEYFNKTEIINLSQLASAQYSNQFLKDLENLRYEKAAQMQEKAWLLNPDTTNTYLLFLSWLFYYEPIDKGDINCALQLGKLSRFLDKGITRDEIVGEFAQLTQKQLLYEGDETLYDSSYHLLMENVSDSTLRDDLSFIYYYERGRILCNKLEFKEALPYTKKAFQLKQKNTDAKTNLLLAINNTLGTEEPKDRLEIVNQLAGEIPVLLDDNVFAQLRLSMYLMMVDLSFYNKNKMEGEQYLKEFEELYPQKNQKYHFLDGDIETAYGTAASYYFRLGQLSRSREVLEKALLYVPNSFNLQNRLNAVK